MPFDGFVENTQVTDRLIIGRARIEAGWCQGNRHRYTWTIWRGRRSEYCLMGAMRLDFNDDLGECDPRVPNVVNLLTAAQDELGYGPVPITEFNDSPGRTKAQVLEVLDLAIAMSRGERRNALPRSD